MELERKQLPFRNAKATGDGSGSVEGYASVFGGVDSYGDTIVPGAYGPHLEEFRRDGFIAWQHDWAAMIGTPAEVREDDTGLYLKADFHSHPRAQEARQITTERLARGHTMGLSIGYQAVKWSYQEGDTPGDRVRLLEEIKLFEVSLVAVPADSFARVSAAKHARSYLERLRQFGTELDDLLSYTKARADMRAREDRALGDETIAALTTLTERLPRVRDELLALVAEPKAGAPDGSDVDSLRLFAEYQHTLARLNGVAV